MDTFVTLSSISDPSLAAISAYIALLAGIALVVRPTFLSHARVAGWAGGNITLTASITNITIRRITIMITEREGHAYILFYGNQYSIQNCDQQGHSAKKV